MGNKTIEQILAPLNKQQLKFATIESGVKVVVAGPGTGKTTAQIACASLKILKGMDPSSLALVTFTNKASEEMRDRLVASVGDDAYKAFVGTFHQFAIKQILRPYHKHDYFQSNGYPDGFSIIDKSDSQSLIREAKKGFSEAVQALLETAKVDEDLLKSTMSLNKAQGMNSHDFYSSIQIDSGVKDKILSASNSTKLDEEYFRENREARKLLVWSWWEKYETLCVRSEAMDFDDLLVHANKLLENDQGICKRLAARFLHIQVDESQDTSPVQFSMFRKIVDMQKVKSLIPVGDMRQAIYGFRGADADSMNNIVDYYDAEVIPMSENYRTAAASITAINQFGQEMANQLTDGVLEAKSSANGPKPVIHHFQNDDQEAAYIVDNIQKKLASGVKPNEIAVIYRSKSVNKAVKSKLELNKLQYDVVGDVDFYSTKEVKIAMAVLRLLVNENDRFALHKIMDELPIGITKVNLNKKASEFQVSPMAYLKQFAKSGVARSQRASELLDELTAIWDYMPVLTDTELASWAGLDLNHFNHEKLINRNFAAKVEEQSDKFRQEVVPLFQQQISSFFTSKISGSLNDAARKAARKKHPEGSDEEIEVLVAEKMNERTERITKLMEIFGETLKTGVTFAEAVDELTLLADNTKNNKEGSVLLMTGHAAKGLEFQHVYFIGAEQETFFREEHPTESTIAEEERVAYVITTRHKEQLEMSYCDARFVNGKTNFYRPLDFLLRFKGTVEERDHTGNEIADDLNGSERTTSTPQENMPPKASDLFANKLRRATSSKPPTPSKIDSRNIEPANTEEHLYDDDNPVLFNI